MKSKLVLSLRIFLGAVFLISSILKIISINEFITNFQEYNFFSEAIVPYIAIIICISELLIGTFIILNILPKLVLNYAIVLLTMFTGFVLYSVLFNKNWYCNCFGSILSAKINYITIIRNSILLTIAIICRYHLTNLFTYKNMTIRKQRVIITIICSLSIIGSLYVNIFKTKKELLYIGKRINVNKIKCIDGSNIKGNTRKQPYLLIIFFSLRDCKYCLMEAFSWQKIHLKYKDKVMVVGIVKRARTTGIKAFILNKKIGFPLFNDSTMSTFNDYDIQTPIKILVDRNDIIIKIDGSRISVNEQNEFIDYINNLK